MDPACCSWEERGRLNDTGGEGGLAWSVRLVLTLHLNSCHWFFHIFFIVLGRICLEIKRSVPGAQVHKCFILVHDLSVIARRSYVSSTSAGYSLGCDPVAWLKLQWNVITRLKAGEGPSGTWNGENKDCWCTVLTLLKVWHHLRKSCKTLNLPFGFDGKRAKGIHIFLPKIRIVVSLVHDHGCTVYLWGCINIETISTWT